MAKFSEQLLDHYRHPRNFGQLTEPDGVGSATQTGCGDVLLVEIKVRDERIAEIRFRGSGCEASVAAGSAMTVLALGKPLDEAAEIPDTAIAELLGGLPADEWHVTALACDALYNAIMDHVHREIDRLWQDDARRHGSV